MRTVGIPRKIDDLGRVVVPVEFRRVLGIHEGDQLEITLDGDHLLLRRIDPACVFCEGVAGLRPFRERWVCESCARELTSD